MIWFSPVLNNMKINKNRGKKNILLYSPSPQKVRNKLPCGKYNYLCGVHRAHLI